MVPGQYTFPFTLTLPPNLPGSHQRDDDNYVKYQVIAYLINYTDKTKPEFSQTTTILENPKEFQGPYNFQQTKDPKCCGCCISYGRTVISVKAQKNYFIPGDTIKLAIEIDNNHSKKPIENVVVSFKESYVRVADGY